LHDVYVLVVLTGWC